MPEAKPAPRPDPKPDAKPALVPAGGSSDPTVQALLAELQTARINENDDAVQRLVSEVAALGYAAE